MKSGVGASTSRVRPRARQKVKASEFSSGCKAARKYSSTCTSSLLFVQFTITDDGTLSLVTHT